MSLAALDSILSDAVRRIVRAAQPRSVILFGSAARREMGPHSDLDFLVVIGAGGHRRKAAQAIYREFVGMGFAADVVVVTEEDVAKYRDDPGLVIQPALEEGKVLYAA